MIRLTTRTAYPTPNPGLAAVRTRKKEVRSVPGVLELELFRRHQALTPTVPRDDMDSIPRIFGPERRSVKAW